MGVEHPGACSRAESDARYRAALVRNSLVLAAWPRIEACPHRGGVLPVSEQREGCGCVGTELTECRAGKGARPGAVTLDECLECRA
jgi:hypothetical protein